MMKIFNDTPFSICDSSFIKYNSVVKSVCLCSQLRQHQSFSLHSKIQLYRCFCIKLRKGCLERKNIDGFEAGQQAITWIFFRLMPLTPRSNRLKDDSYQRRSFRDTSFASRLYDDINCTTLVLSKYLARRETVAVS